MNILYFDTETTGLPSTKAPLNDPSQPHITQLGFILEVNGTDALMVDTFIRPDETWRIHEDSGTVVGKIASELTGITAEMLYDMGIPIADALEMFIIAAENANLEVCHNTSFDNKLLAIQYARLRPDSQPRDVLCGKPSLCTMKAATPICKIPKKGVTKTTGVNWKWPKLVEAMQFFYGEELEGAHSAIVDIKATRRVFHTLVNLGAFDEQVTTMLSDGRVPQSVMDAIMDGFPEDPALLGIHRMAA